MIRRLGVIGDLHGEHERLAMLLDWFAGMGVDALVCTGDVADGRGCLNRSCELLQEGSVLTVAGNHDRWLLEERVRHVENAHSRGELSDGNREFLSNLPRWRSLETARGPLLLCHGMLDDDLARVWPGRKPDEVRRNETLDELVGEGHYRFVINGHMHFRMLIDFEQLTLMNAGTVSGTYAGVSMVDFQSGEISVYGVSDDAPPARQLAVELDPGCSRPVWRTTCDFDGSRDPVTLYPR